LWFKLYQCRAFTPLWVAQDAGLFKKHGVEATLKLLNSQVAIQALVAGDVDVISSGPDLVNVRLQGVPVKCIGGTLQRFIFQLWGAKGSNAVAELKGKTIAVTTPRTSTEIATREALKKTGVISDKDVSFVLRSNDSCCSDCCTQWQNFRGDAFRAEYSKGARCGSQSLGGHRSNQRSWSSSRFWHH
jgi:ABC-type nitrate/sulfonate/bicarbonate transport system substrate-binding protein